MLDVAELTHLLSTLLAGAAGGEEAHWRALIGELQVFPMATHPSCNWRAHPDGTNEERIAIAKAIELVREQHPHARW